MKHTKEEIVAALQVIKDECENQEGSECAKCAFFKFSHGCMITNKLPINWNIVYVEPETTWRAFE